MPSIRVVACLLAASLTAYGGPASATLISLERGRNHYALENYEKAVAFIEQAQGTLEARRSLALSYFHMLRYEQARPLLEWVLAADPADHTVRLALATILVELGQWRVARPHLEQLKRETPHTARVWQLEGRLLAERGQRGAAITAYAQALQLARDEAKAEVALELVPLYVRLGKLEAANAVVEEALGVAPHAFEADELRLLREELAARRRRPEAARAYSIELGYQLEHDDYLVVESEDPLAPSGQETRSDTRHVLTAALRGRHALNDNRELYGRAQWCRSIHAPNPQMDQFQQRYLFGYRRYAGANGYQVPVELSYTTLDTDFYHSAVSLLPGVYHRLNKEQALHLQQERYEDDVREEERRSGSKYGLTALAQQTFAAGKGVLYFSASDLRNDSEGLNWDYRQQRLTADLFYHFTEQWIGRVFFGLSHQGFDNVHDYYLP